MSPTPSWSFGPFRLDPASGCLWRGEELLPLPPKPLAVLTALVAHAGQVVTKETLLEAVWPETVVTEGVLKTSLGQVRQMLGETARAPQYIATVHRRGYRFLAPVTVEETSQTLPTVSPLLREQHPQPRLASPGPRHGQTERSPPAMNSSMPCTRRPSIIGSRRAGGDDGIGRLGHDWRRGTAPRHRRTHTASHRSPP